MGNIKEILQKYGLNQKQADLYLSALYLGTGSITQLSKKSALKRSTTYVIIDELIAKNLLTTVIKGKKIYYKAQDPEKLVEVLEDNKLAIKQILPELKNIYQKNLKQPKVSFYEGKEKIYQVYEEIFRSKEIWAMFSYNKYLEIFGQESGKHFFNLLNRQGGVLYNLLEDSVNTRKLTKEKYRKGSGETKILPKDFKFNTDILVFDNKIALISFDNLTSTVIEDKSIADSLRLTLRFIWESIK